MIKKILLPGIFLLVLNSGFGQRLFDSDYPFYNPAYVGMYDKNNITFSTSEFYYKDWINLSKGRVSLNFPLKKIFSGVGVHTTYNKYGFSSTLDFGAIYSFKYNFGDNFSVSIGSNFSIHRYKIKGEFFLSDPYNYDYDTEYVNERVYLFNIDVGLWLRYKNFQIGITNQHINQPSRTFTFLDGTSFYKLSSVADAIVKYDLNIGQNYRLKNSLLIYDLKSFLEDKDLRLNNLFEIRNAYLIGLSTEVYKANDIKVLLSPNVGFNLSDKFRFVASFDLIKINVTNSVGKTIEGVVTYNF